VVRSGETINTYNSSVGSAWKEVSQILRIAEQNSNTCLKETAFEIGNW
jgi:hypothetical protein